MLETTVLAARLALAVVFGVAGAAKLRDRKQFYRAVRLFGVPSVLIRATVNTLPLMELGIALALLTSLAWPAAVVACTLLTVFSGGIAANLAHGRTPECRCFGQIHARPIGPMTLARNAALAVVAGVVVWEGPALGQQELFASLAALTGIRPVAVVICLGVTAVIVAQAILQWNLLRQHGRLLWRVDNLERQLGIGGAPSAPADMIVPKRLSIGATAPSFDLPTSSGANLSLEQLLRGGLPLLLIFSDPGCRACDEFLPTVRDWQVRYAARMRLAVISRVSNEGPRIRGLRTQLFQRDHEIADAYGVPGTPAALLVRADGIVDSAVMLGGKSIATLLHALPVAGDDNSTTVNIEAVA